MTAFASLACRRHTQKILLIEMSKNILPMFSSKSFMFSGLQSILSFYIYCVCVCLKMLWESNPVWFFCKQLSSFPQHQTLKRLLFLIAYPCLLCCCWLTDHKKCGLLLGSILFHWSVFEPGPYCFWLLRLCNIVWNQAAWYLLIFSNFSRRFYLGVFCFHKDVRFVLVVWKMPLVFW